MGKNDKWLQWAVELQSLAQAGLTYGRDIYDKERYGRIRDISTEILSTYTEIPIDKVKNLFCNETGYQTPKLDARVAIIALFQNKNKGSVNENLNAEISEIKEATENGADLILFPEVQLTEFFPQYPRQDVSGYAWELDGEIIQAFQAAC